MTALEKVKSCPDVVDYFKKLPFYKTHTLKKISKWQSHKQSTKVYRLPQTKIKQNWAQM